MHVKRTREIRIDNTDEEGRERNGSDLNLCQGDLIHGRWTVRGIRAYRLRFTEFPRYSRSLFLLGGRGQKITTDSGHQRAIGFRPLSRIGIKGS